MPRNFEIGYTGCYIADYPFRMICEIPAGSLNSSMRKMKIPNSFLFF